MGLFRPRQGKAKRPPPHPVRDTLFLVLFLVVLALSARTFVVEAYMIPTGSMAPTLLGSHRHAVCPDCGHAFEVDAKGRDRLSCPLCHARLKSPEEVLPGDRIFVAKGPFRPCRWDVVVFHDPQRDDPDPVHPRFDAPGPNSFYIKRAVGLPGEDLYLLDGHVYVRKPGEPEFKIARRADPDENPRWEGVARAMWRPVWRKPAAHGDTRFDFEAAKDGERPAYDDATLHPYNQPVQGFRHRGEETIEDVRLAARTRGEAAFFCSAPFAGGLRLERAKDGHVRLLAGATPLGEAQLPGGAEAPAVLELWLLDREALVFADGRCLLRHAFDQPWAQTLAEPAPPDVPEIRFSGALENLELDAALPYLPGGHGLDTARGGLARAAKGRLVMTDPVSLPSGKGDAEACWFCLGDNSPASTDGRYWNDVHPAVEERPLGGHVFLGVVPESLMVGRAWGVFWPASGPVRRIR